MYLCLKSQYEMYMHAIANNLTIHKYISEYDMFIKTIKLNGKLVFKHS